MRTEGDAFLKIYPALAGPRCGGANFVKSVSLRWLLRVWSTPGNRSSNP